MDSRPIILINTANIIKGGAIQVAVNFILELSKEKTSFDLSYVLSKQVHDELLKIGAPLEFSFIESRASPSRDYSARKAILDYERTVNPCLVFSIFGPSYIPFKTHQLSGFANGWVTHSKLKTFMLTHGSIIRAFQAFAKYVYYAYQVRKSDYWILETELSRNGLVKRLKVDKAKTFVIPNTSIAFGENFENAAATYVNGKLLEFCDNNFLMLSAYYPHKNFEAILQAVSSLKERYPCKKFKLILTLEEEVFSAVISDTINNLNIKDRVVNLGKVDVCDLPSLYSITLASVLPSFIETFSAIYPESLATKTPIITSDLPFAREICKGAALYIEPSSPQQIADAMDIIMSDVGVVKELTEKGTLVYRHMLSPKQKMTKYLEVFDHIINSSK